MMVGEIGKQIYYYGTPARLPVNFCGVLLIVAPVYLLCCKCKWKRCIDISATCTYIDAFCIFATFVIYPKLLVNSLPASGIFWTNYQDF
jgi:hypothetical protein